MGDLIDCLEANVIRVHGVAVILDIFAASPQDAGALIDTGETYTVLSDVLREASKDLNDLLEKALDRREELFDLKEDTRLREVLH